MLRDLRRRDLLTAGIPASVPIRVTENGWPTGSNRFPAHRRAPSCSDRPAVRAVHRVAGALNITHYMLFGLRDADSSKPDLFHRLGIMRGRPRAKATFHSLVRELGG